ncbi:ABC transporter ATP-binding protein [Isoptericola sp. NPDC057191]|uniref:ABC transporter ATP-binding protein n=1 Tax=Isoptericola sp. NPDC057191 TaxID=3346041 RepID=UPI00363F3682
MQRVQRVEAGQLLVAGVAAPETRAVRLDGAEVRYRRAAIGPITLTFRPGITCLVGANGAGKSTLFRVLAGVQAPTFGSVQGVGRTGGISTVGYLPQELGLPRTATCRQYLDYVAWVYGVPRGRRRAAVDTALQRADLTTRADVPIRSLSGGMRRRLAFAHAVVHDPQVLLLDEPTVGLDPVQRQAMRDVIQGASGGRVTVISTHLVDDVRALADRVIVLDAGHVVYDGDVTDLEETSGDDLEAAITALMVHGDERLP